MHLGYIIAKLNNGLSFQVTKQSSSLTEYLRSLRDGKGYIASNGWLITTGSQANINVNTSTITLPEFEVHASSRPCTVYGISTSFRNTVYNAVLYALDELIDTAIEDAEGNIITPVDGLPVAVDGCPVVIEAYFVPVQPITSVPHTPNTHYMSF